MAFNDDATRDGRGRALRVDISTDSFSTVAYRYGDIAGELDGTNWYEPRVVNAPTVRRALGNNRIATSGGCELELSNPDGGVDWLCGRESISAASKVKMRLYVVLYDPAAPTSFTSKLLGEFFLEGWPVQDSDKVRVKLADAFLAPLSTGAALPTIADWAAVGTPSNNPLRAGAGSGLPSYGLPDVLSPDTPIQLAFGEDWVEALPHVLPWENTTYGKGKIVVPLFTTTSAAAAAAADVTNLRVEVMAPALDGTDTVRLIDIPASVVEQPWSTTPATTTIWGVEKSPAITKAGRTFYVVYLVVSATFGPAGTEFDPLYGVVAPPVPAPEAYASTQAALRGRYRYSGGYPFAAVDWHSGPRSSDFGSNYATHAARALRWWVKGPSLSARETVGPQQHPVDVVIDLVEQYAPGSLTVDATSAARVKAGTPHARAAGVVQGWREFRPGQPPPSMRQVLSAVAQSADMDVYVTWAGSIGLASDVWDFTTATQQASLVTIPESRIAGQTRWVASAGERGAPFNRLYFEGGRPYDAEGREAPFAGPFDFDFGADGLHVALADRVLECILSQGWRPWAQTAQSPWYWRNIDARARDRVSFTIGLDGLQLDLGDYFLLEWGSNRSAPYASAAVFQVESLTYAAAEDVVQVEATWRDDTTDSRHGYLLDDETLLVRTKNASGVATLNLDLGLFDITSGLANFTTMGVKAGDVLVVRDSTESATAFVRNVSVRVLGIVTDTRLEINAGSGVFSGILDADWYIVRGATTYHTAVSDPTNYPSGGEMYGKVTDSNGNFSDTTEGNRLING